MSEQIEMRIKEVKENIIWYKVMISQIKEEIKYGVGDAESLCNHVTRYKDRLSRARDEFKFLKGKVL